MPLFARGRIKTTELLRFALAQRRAAEAMLTERVAALSEQGIRATWLLLIGTLTGKSWRWHGASRRA